MLSLMADHNRWMNEKLYAVCAGIPDEARKRDLGAFFRFIHGTLNHLLLVDRLGSVALRANPFLSCRSIRSCMRTSMRSNANVRTPMS